MSDTNKLITSAEKEISKVLAKLESDIGMVLDTLYVQDLEVRSIADNRPQLLRTVVIKMKRLPGLRVVGRLPKATAVRDTSDPCGQAS